MTGSISVVALSFIVHEPSGIIECARERSCARALQVAKHLVLGVVRVEHRVLHELDAGKSPQLGETEGRSSSASRSAGCRRRRTPRAGVDVLERRRLVDGDADDVISDDADVDAPGDGGIGDSLGIRDLDRDGVEEGPTVLDSVSELLYSGGQIRQRIRERGQRSR